MEANRTVVEAIPKFDWVGLAALLIGIAIPIQLLERAEYLIPLCLLILVRFVRRYDWKNTVITLIIVFTLFYPIRMIEDWSVNTVLYGVITAISFLLIIYAVRVYGWKSLVTGLFILCVLLSLTQTIASAVEVDTCHIEDIRWTKYYSCEATGMGYQQIASTSLAMQSWCYYCFWY
jgi:hypothetical protein